MSYYDFHCLTLGYTGSIYDSSDSFQSDPTITILWDYFPQVHEKGDVTQVHKVSSYHEASPEISWYHRNLDGSLRAYVPRDHLSAQCLMFLFTPREPYPLIVTEVLERPRILSLIMVLISTRIRRGW